MSSIEQMQINIVTAYIAFIEDLASDNPAEADNLLLVLRIYQGHLKVKAKCKPATFNWLMTMKHGVRQTGLLLKEIFQSEAEEMRGWFAGCKAANEIQLLASLLFELVLELTKEIEANEALYPELQFAYDRERAQYAQMEADAR